MKAAQTTMTDFFLGADLGGTHTRVVVCNASGTVLGFGESGPGNHETVGFDGVTTNLRAAASSALASAEITPSQVAGAGFGVAGYDWQIEYEPLMAIIRTLNLGRAVEMVNDCELGLLAGSPAGWGISVVSGTGCNCRGWNHDRTQRGRVTGGGVLNGEFAGASELVFKAVHALSDEWTGRGTSSLMSRAFIQKYGVRDLEQLLQDSAIHRIEFSAADALLVFQAAAQGDEVALDLILWAGQELGKLAITVIHQLNFKSLAFDLVLIGSMFDGSPLLESEMQIGVHAVAPKAHFIRFREPPVAGAVLLGMQAAGHHIDERIRKTLIKSISKLSPTKEG